MRARRIRLICAPLVCAVLAGTASMASGTTASQSHRAAELDAANLRLAAQAIEAQALISGALKAPIHSSSPAIVILQSDEALIAAARRADPSRRPVDTRAVMGSVPYNLIHHLRHRPHHHRVLHTRTLLRFHRAVGLRGGFGVGAHDGAKVAAFQQPDGVYVDPRLPALSANPTVAEVALRSAMQKIGQPYVWAGAGPSTYDCSGLVMAAYAHAGIKLTHYTGAQWNEGRLIPPRDALPGDLILYGNPIFHVGMYLGAGWMLNAPYTGHYVGVAPVWKHVAGIVRP